MQSPVFVIYFRYSQQRFQHLEMRETDMWSIYAKIEGMGGWIDVAGGYTTPEKAAADLETIKQDWLMADAFMVGMVVWRDES